jgi:hypothetical protein
LFSPSIIKNLVAYHNFKDLLYMKGNLIFILFFCGIIYLNQRYIGIWPGLGWYIAPAPRSICARA